MSIDYSKIHFNSGLLVSQMLQRGIKVCILPGTDIIQAEFAGRVEYIDQTDIRLMPAPLRNILDDKWKGKCLMKDLKLPVAEGKAFEPADIQKAKDYAKKIGFPVVIKPVVCSHGFLVRMNIDDEEEFEAVFYQLCQETHQQQDILVEKQMQGAEFRLTVTRNDFFAAVHRSPASVMGDGNSNLRQLAQAVTSKRMEKRDNCLCGIWLDPEAERYLSKKGLNLDYVPIENEQVFIRSNSNVSTGGGCTDVTDIVHPFYRKIAFSLLEKLPDLPYVGIDLLTDDITRKGNYVICELNAAPGLSLHTHPGRGKPRDLPKAIVDLLFPESVKQNSSFNIRILQSQFKDLPQLSAHFQKKQPEAWFFKPVMLELELTQNCNLRCKGCAIIEDIEKGDYGLETEVAIDVLKQAAEIGLYCYSITGGEPFTRFKDLLKIISSCPEMDCYKIQTNGTVFRNKKTTLRLLEQLKESGFGLNNKYISSSLRCSVGMQDREKGVNFSRTYLLGDHFFEVFSKEKAGLAFILTHPIEKDATEARADFLHQYALSSKKPFDPEGMHVRTIFLHSAPGLKKDHQKVPRVPLRQFLKDYAGEWECFDNSKAQVPWPKMLLRANGDVYTCSCFGHVFQVGNIKQNSLKEIIQRANEHRLFKLIEQKGLMGFLEEAEKFNPKISENPIPLTASICQICKLMKGTVESGERQSGKK